MTRTQAIVFALATTATPRNRIATLNRLGIANLFEVAADIGDVSEPKPSPEIYLTVTSRLALQPSQCLVVEDSLTGVLSAKRAGCCVSALTRTFAAHELLGVGADFIFEDFQSLESLLRSRSTAVKIGSLRA
jgi:beta-phosphoglucomutase-like phosphatase (HAD superfamily)